MDFYCILLLYSFCTYMLFIFALSTVTNVAIQSITGSSDLTPSGEWESFMQGLGYTCFLTQVEKQPWVSITLTYRYTVLGINLLQTQPTSKSTICLIGTSNLMRG